MQEQDLRVIPALHDLQILELNHPATAKVLDECKACEIAEADDTVRLWDLLHRNEYRPLCGVRVQDGPDVRVRVYFRRLHSI